MKSYIINSIIKVINFIMPKTSNKIIFRSEPDYSDNAKALYSYINQNYRDEYKLVWIVKNEYIFNRLKKENVNVYKRNSIKGLIEFCTAKYIIGTHAQFSELKNYNQIYVNLWHGMPLKNIGFLENVDNVGEKYLRSEKRKFEKMDYIIATSKIMRSTMSSVFYTDVRNIFITGQPRNDFLFLEDSKEKLNSCMDKIEFDKYKKIIMYIPTFRNGLGKSDSDVKLYNMLNLKKYNENELNNFLEHNNYLLLIKFHPFEENVFKESNFSNIKILESKQLSKSLITLNEFINISDLLITDYSSVYFDYLLTNKPILFINTDENEYIKKRGFLFDNPNFWRPGPKVDNLYDLIYESNKLMDNNMYYSKERHIVNSLVNQHNDENSSKRVFDLILKK